MIKKILLAVILTWTIQSCDDGDIVVEELDFSDQTMQACLPETLDGSATRPYVFYKINNESSESVNVAFSTAEPILIAEEDRFSIPLSNSNRFEYRRYNRAPSTDYFCVDVPPADIRVVEQLTAESGTMVILSEAMERDDNDGVPAEIEGFTNDTDNDGILDYLDSDDDGDNVPTSNEAPGTVVDGMMNGRDSDGDGILDYLDSDDDGDGIPTIQEDLNRDLNPQNDLNSSGVPFYLSETNTAMASPLIDSYRPNIFTTQNQLSISFEGLVLDGDSSETIRESYILGTFSAPEIQITSTPDF